MTRVAVVLALAAIVAVIALRYRRAATLDAAQGATPDGVRWPTVPVEHLVPEVACTWLIFTTPWCASCDQVEGLLSASFPHHGVRKVDATRHIALGEQYDVRRAPTTLLADRSGAVLERLVGPEDVTTFVGTLEPTSLLNEPA